MRDILIFKERNKINIKLYARHNNYASPRLIRYYNTDSTEKAFVKTASRVILYAETSYMHCKGVVLAQPSKQAVLKFLWASSINRVLDVSIDFKLNSSYMVGWIFHPQYPSIWQMTSIKND